MYIIHYDFPLKLFVNITLYIYYISYTIIDSLLPRKQSYIQYTVSVIRFTLDINLKFPVGFHSLNLRNCDHTHIRPSCVKRSIFQDQTVAL